MVVGGYPSDSYYKSEIYDLSGQNLNCTNVTDLPIEYGSVGTFINNKTLVCGGYTYPSVWFSECYSYNMEVKYLKMTC